MQAGLENLREDALSINSPLYHEQQEEVVRNIITHKRDGFIAFLICALCQSGKTEVIIAYICIMMSEDPEFNPDNLILMTGLDSKDWREQMSERFPDGWCDTNIYRRSGRKFKNAGGKDLVKVIEGRENLTLVIDEIHLVAGKNMTISTMFDDIGLESYYNFASRNISVIGLSATPGKVQSEFERFWTREMYLPLKMEPGDGYTGLERLDSLERVKQCSPFTTKPDEAGNRSINTEVVIEISRVIRKIPFKTINFIRVPHGWDPTSPRNQDEVRSLFSTALQQDVTIRSYTQRDKDVTLDGILESVGMSLSSGEPIQTTFILLVDKFRVSKTLNDPRFLGVMYDRGTKIEDVAIQGFAGRICGYKTNAHSEVFTDLKHVNGYLKWWNDGCPAIPGGRRAITTWAGKTGSSNNRVETTDVLVKFFHAKSDLLEWGATNVSLRGGHQLSEDKSVFHECTLRERAIRSCEWVEANRGWGFSSSHDTPRTFHCYQDVSDPSTLRYALCYRPHHVHN